MAPIALSMKSEVLTLAWGSGQSATSLTSSPLLSSTPATPASSLFLEYARLAPASGPLHLLSPLPGTLFPQKPAWITLLLLSGLYFYASFPVRSSNWAFYLKSLSNLTSPSALPYLFSLYNELWILLIYFHFLSPCDVRSTRAGTFASFAHCYVSNT